MSDVQGSSAPHLPSGLTPGRVAQVALATLGVLLLMGAVVAAAAVSDRIPDTGYLTRDPTSVGRIPWWAGSISRLTNLCWAAAATLAVLAGLLDRGRLRRPLVLLGVFIAVLALDDTLLLHDAVLPGRGIPERLVTAAYGVAGLALAVLWLPLRRTAVGMAFYLGGLLLAVSLGIDVVWGDLYVREDTPKLLGVLVWGLGGWWAFSDAAARHSSSEGTVDDGSGRAG